MVKGKPKKKKLKVPSKLITWLQGQKADALKDLVLDVGLAALGVKAFGSVEGALLGPVSLRLARTRGGTPPIAQMTGVAGLVILGVANAGNKDRPGVEAHFPAGQPEIGKALINAKIDPMSNLATCPKGYRKITPYPGLIMCQKAS